MKVLLCHNFYRQPGGEKRAVEAQRRLLEARGHRVTLLTRDNADLAADSAGHRLRAAAAAVWSREAVEAVRRQVDHERPDVAHVHNVFPQLSPALYRALHGAGIPIVQTLHNYRFLCPNGLLFTHGAVCKRCRTGSTLPAVALSCYRDSRAASAAMSTSIGLHRRSGTFRLIDRLLALTPFQADLFRSSPWVRPERVEVLGNFIPDPLPEPRPPATPPYFLFLGRLTADKGVDVLLDAFAAAPELELRIAGEGPAGEALRQAADERGLGNVRFLGFVRGDAKEDLLGRARATLVPSRWYEVLPFSLLESLAQRVPAVVTGHGSLASVITDGEDGLHVPPDDPAAVARAVRRLATEDGLRDRLARNARALVEERYGEETHYRRLMEVYRR